MVTVPGSPFSISARRAISGRPEREVRASTLTPRRIISASTDPNFWPARIFRPLRPTNFDQLTRKGMGSRHFPRVYHQPSLPLFSIRSATLLCPGLRCCVQRPERGCYGCDQREIKFLTIETIPVRLAACSIRARVFLLQHRENHQLSSSIRLRLIRCARERERV